MDATTAVNELRAEIRREDLLLLLNRKFPRQIPTEWVAAINAETNLVALGSWLIHAAFSASPAEFTANTRIVRKRRK